MASLIDEIPVLSVAAAFAEGTTRFSGAAELRVKETDRVATTVELLAALGVGAEPAADGLKRARQWGQPARGGTVNSYGDHRIAMAGSGGRTGRPWRSEGSGLGRNGDQLPELRGGHAHSASVDPVRRRTRPATMSSPSTGPAGSGKSTVATGRRRQARDALPGHRCDVPGGGVHRDAPGRRPGRRSRRGKARCGHAARGGRTGPCGRGGRNDRNSEPRSNPRP